LLSFSDCLHRGVDLWSFLGKRICFFKLFDFSPFKNPWLIGSWVQILIWGKLLMIILGSIFILDVERIQTSPRFLYNFLLASTHFIPFYFMKSTSDMNTLQNPNLLPFMPFARVISTESREHPLH